MNKIYFTITGTCYYYGKEFMEKDMKVTLEKEPDNEFDKEAIMVKVEGLGKVGYVANSWHSVIGDSFSAGRLYDCFGESAEGKIIYVLKDGVLCELIPQFEE